MADQKFSVQMETLVFGFREVSAFQICIWLQLSTKFERKYIATLTIWCLSSVAAKHRRRFLPHAQIYQFCIFKNGKSGPTMGILPPGGNRRRWNFPGTFPRSFRLTWGLGTPQCSRGSNHGRICRTWPGRRGQ